MADGGRTIGSYFAQIRRGQDDVLLVDGRLNNAAIVASSLKTQGRIAQIVMPEDISSFEPFAAA